MLKLIRKHKKTVSLFLIWVMTQGIFLESALALTSGPETPESSGFSPAGLDNLVDPFTGDFSYNVDLLNVGGFPVNIAYSSGVTPDTEASWVGLGWSLNVGSVSRSKRGLPDDFAGDQVKKEYNTKPNQTFGVSGNMSFEAYGAEFAKVGLNANLSYNNYNGFGLSVGYSPSVNSSKALKSSFTGSLGINASLGSESGLSVSPKLGLSYKQDKDKRETTLNSSLSFPMSTREGLKGTTLSGGISVRESNTSVSARKGADGDNNPIGGVSGSAFQGYAAPTYTPSMENSTYNVNVTLNSSFSQTDPATDGFPFGFGGYYSGQFLSDPVKNTPAYGYMYSGVSQDDNKLMDFNREKDGAYNEHTKNLAVTNFTHDIFQVSGQGPGSQGVSGAYRLHRNEIGAVHDASATGKAYAPSIGADFGFGVPPSTKVGIDLGYNQTNTNSGKWTTGRQGIANFQNARQYEISNPGEELVFFKRIGEMTLDNDVNFSSTVKGGKKVMNNGLKSSSKWLGDGELSGKFNYTSNGVAGTMPVSGSKKSKRDFRNGSMMYLTAGELNGNSNKEIRPIESYPQNTFTWRQEKNNFRASNDKDVKVGYTPIQKTFNRVDNVKKSHHLSEFRVTGSTGARYIYGIPTYNHTQEEVTFATTAMPKGGPEEVKAYLEGLVNYVPEKEDSRENKNGLDHMFNRVTTPAFASSFLLTSILSSDYVDRDNVKGPSDGDLGTYTKFNYTKAIDKYKWRTPFSKDGNEAGFSEGLLGSDDDNKANYVYGEKEIWYTHSIETRTHVAEFYLSDREDGRGVDSKHGRIGGKKQKKLDKIVLYSKPDKFNSNPEVIKTVHFEYDYSLSPETPNSTAATGGKLTLKKIWFTYGDSNKGILNPYEFNYARQRFTGVASTDKEPENRLNPVYSHKNYDRWGVYKPDYGTAAEKGKLNAEFPYTDPNKQQSDEYAAAYALTAIKSPTGGTTRVFYEADDYGYVQNRQAMRMFKVVGMSKKPHNGVPQSILYPINSKFENLTDYEYIVIDLEEGFTPRTTSTTSALKNQEFQNKYLKDIDVMYYKFLIKVLDGFSLGKQDRKEFVRGYAEIEKDFSVLGVPKNGKYKRAYIKVKPTKIKSFGKEKNVLPMIKSGWLFAHTTLSRELMGSANADDGGVEQVLRSLLSMIKTISELTSSFSKSMMTNNHSSTFEPSRSFVRLNEPDKIKIGGGHRVKAVVMVDNWDIMVSDKEAADNEASKQLAAYGQHYDYSMIENGEVISSGVAAYEPVPGGDENPFRMPIFSKEKIPLAPDKESFVEEPFGEFAFPSPKVGYRKVTVKPLKVVDPNNPLNSIYEDDVIGKDANNKDIIADDGDDVGGEWMSDAPLGNGTGKVVNEFYTAYDFPTKVRQTKLDVKRHKPKLLFKFLKFDNKDLVTCTQGYSVELNDMHGKQYKKSVYAETSDAVTEPEPISEIENLYKFTQDGKLSNEVTVINNDLSITREGSGAELGVEVDVVQDERFYETTTIGGGLQFNLKWVQAGPIPIFVPTFFPDFTYDKTRFRSLVTTKVVNKYAISSGTIAKDNGAAITSKNLAWDAQTGEVLVTETQNEFHDPIYSFNYPGHWAYDRLKHAAQNEGLRFTKSNSSTAKQYLKDGDEFIVSGTPDNVGFCFYDKPNDEFIDADNNEVTNYLWMKLVRSGGRNMATTPIGSTTTLENPIAAGATKVNFEKVLNTSVNEFKDLWYEFCNCTEFDNEPHATENPFILGKRGNLRPWRNWAYLTNRTQTQWNNNLSVRSDGVFDEYTPFWQYSSANKLLLAPSQNQLNNLKWQFVSQIEKYNAVGLAMEQVDALNRFTMAQFGYGKNLQVAGASNAEYREAGYDGFEDYDFADCEDDHFNFRVDDADKVTEEEAHTGRKSIKVGPDENVQMHRVIIPCNNYNAPSNRLK